MEQVTGIGGVFFAANDPDGLSLWYEERLGVLRPPSRYGDPSWEQQAGPTAFTAMGSDAPQFTGGRRWSINFRVADLDAMIAQLRGLGEQVEIDPSSYPNGRFASMVDPEGNIVELWEPAG